MGMGEPQTGIGGWQFLVLADAHHQKQETERNMKTKNKLATCVALVALTGCNPSSSSTGEKPPATPAPTGAVTELPKHSLNRESPPVPVPAVAAAKAEFIASTEPKLKDLETKIDELAKKSANYTDGAKLQAEQALTALRDQRAKLTEKFDALKKSGTAGWTELKAGFESALNELEKAYENAKSKFG